MVNSDNVTISEATKKQIDSLTKLLRTCLICEVVEFDEKRNLVDLQPVNKTKFSGSDEAVEMPIINHVPIVFFGGGDMWMTMKPKKGDNCLAIISDRSIDVWKNKGKIVDPAIARHHDINDAIAIFGLNYYDDAIKDIEPDTIHIRAREGATGGKFTSSDVTIHSGDTTSTVKSGEVKIDVGGGTTATLTSSDCKIESNGATVNISAQGVVMEATKVAMNAANIEVTGESSFIGNMIVTGIVTAAGFVEA